MTTRTYPEPLVARVTGISKHTVVGARKAHLAKDADWLLERNVVCYTPAGLEKLLAALGMDAASLEWPAAGEGHSSELGDEAREQAADGAGEASAPVLPVAASPEKLLGVGGEHRELQRWPWPRSAAAAVAQQVQEMQAEAAELTVCRILGNPSILEAKTGEGETVRVRVRTNVNFIPRMKLKARPPVPGGAPVWTLVGNCPRWRGRY